MVVGTTYSGGPGFFPMNIPEKTNSSLGGGAQMLMPYTSRIYCSRSLVSGDNI